MKNIVFLFLSFLFLWQTSGAQQVNVIGSTNAVGIGTTTPVAGSNLHVYRNASGNYNPLVMLQDALPGGYTQLGFKGIGRTYHLGVGNTTTGGLDVSDKFFIWDQNASLVRLVIDPSGYVGIGTTAPKVALDLKELKLGLESQLPAEGSIPEGAFGNYILGNVNTAQRLRMGVSNDGYTKSEIFLDNGNRVDGTISLKTSNSASAGAQTRLFINGDGNVSIGTTDAKGYRFAVNGDAVFTKIKVKLNNQWPDYVFDKKYTLPSLSNLEQYIADHHHLPNVPSVTEIDTDGIDVSQTQVTLLEKIEELTLYLIEQNKKLEAQQEQIEEQRRQIRELQKLAMQSAAE